MSEIVKTDKELVDSYRNGDVNSFNLLINRHQNQIYSYIMTLVKNKQLADDIFQDTFLKIIQTIKSGKYDEDGRFVPFAMRIAHNLVIDYFRKETRIPLVESTSDDYSFVDNAPVSDPSIEQSMVMEQIYGDLHKMIEYLPMDQREVLRMRIFDDMSFKDIAEVTNVSINTALGRMRYAILNMRKMIAANDMVMSF